MPQHIPVDSNRHGRCSVWPACGEHAVKNFMARVPTRQGKECGFTLIEMMVVVGIIGILTVIAIPNFLRYQAQTRQAEAKTNLGGIFVAELAYYGENARFGSFSEIIYSLTGMSNRYTYRSGAPGAAGGPSSGTENIDLHSSSVGASTVENSVVAARNGLFGFTATATGNLDSDGTIDQWHVNDLKSNLKAPDVNDVSG